jgi:hypothetical protein
MDESVSGGMACEPTLVFPQCQGHVLVAHRMIEQLLQEPARYERQRLRWESFLLSSMRANVGTGALSIFISDRLGVATPVGHLGADGWGLHYQFAWSKKFEICREIYQSATKKILDQFSTLHAPVAPEDQIEHDPASCCSPLSIPRGTWVTSLMPVAAQSGDAKTVHAMAKWASGLLVEKGPKGARCLNDGPEWQIGSTANMLQGLLLNRDPGALRRLSTAHTPVQGPVVVERVEPRGILVWRCFVDAATGVLRCGLASDAGSKAKAVTLILGGANAPNVKNVSGQVTEWTWTPDERRLVVDLPAESCEFDVSFGV